MLRAIIVVVALAAAPAAAQSSNASSGRVGGTRILELSPDGLTLAQIDSRNVHLWDLLRGVERVRLHARFPVDSAAFSPDGATLVAIASDTVRLWRVADGAERTDWRSGTYANAAAFSPDGRSLAVAHGALISIWDLEAGRETLLRDPQDVKAASLLFSLDGAQLVVGGADRTVRVWDLKTRVLRRVFGGPPPY